MKSKVEVDGYSITFDASKLSIEHKRPKKPMERTSYKSSLARAFLGERKFKMYRTYVFNRPTKEIPLLVMGVLNECIVGLGLNKNLILGVKRFMELKNADKQ